MTNIAQKLKDLGINLPTAPAPVASYVSSVKTGNLLIISGQVAIENGQVKYTGKVGADVTLETGIEAARLCGINILAQINQAINGDWSKVKRIVRLGVFVQSADTFYDQPQVANGASNLMQDIFGDAGKHARAAVGVNALPKNSAVEVEALVELTD